MGGTGVVTVGALLGMAAHLEGGGCGIIDMAGLAQKGGAVVSHIQLAAQPDDITAIRVAAGGADVLIGCDLLVSASAAVLSTLDRESSHVVVNTHQKMPGEFASNPDLHLPTTVMQRRLSDAVAAGSADFLNATQLATTLLGDSIAANLFMLGVAYQRGLIPVGQASIARAIELNNVAVDFNKSAFHLGRVWVADRESLEKSVEAPKKQSDLSLAELVERRVGYLTDYQSAAYAERYRALVERVIAVDEHENQALSRAVAHGSVQADGLQG